VRLAKLGNHENSDCHGPRRGGIEVLLYANPQLGEERAGESDYILFVCFHLDFPVLRCSCP